MSEQVSQKCEKTNHVLDILDYHVVYMLGYLRRFCVIEIEIIVNL